MPEVGKMQIQLIECCALKSFVLLVLKEICNSRHERNSWNIAKNTMWMHVTSTCFVDCLLLFWVRSKFTCHYQYFECIYKSLALHSTISIVSRPVVNEACSSPPLARPIGVRLPLLPDTVPSSCALPCTAHTLFPHTTLTCGLYLSLTQYHYRFRLSYHLSYSNLFRLALVDATGKREVADGEESRCSCVDGGECRRCDSTGCILGMQFSEPALRCRISRISGIIRLSPLL